MFLFLFLCAYFPHFSPSLFTREINERYTLSVCWMAGRCIVINADIDVSIFVFLTIDISPVGSPAAVVLWKFFKSGECCWNVSRMHIHFWWHREMVEDYRSQLSKPLRLKFLETWCSLFCWLYIYIYIYIACKCLWQLHETQGYRHYLVKLYLYIYKINLNRELEISY